MLNIIKILFKSKSAKVNSCVLQYALECCFKSLYGYNIIVYVIILNKLYKS